MSETNLPAPSETPSANLSLTDIQDQLDKHAFTTQQYVQRTNDTFQQIFGTMERLERLVTGLVAARPPSPSEGILGRAPAPLQQVPPIIQATQGPPRFHSMKLELPKFDGSNPSGWLFRATEYFEFHDTPDAQRVRISSFTMKGKASEWYQWMKRNELLTTWENFQRQVELRFGPSRFEDYQGKLSKLLQRTTVTEYQSEFEYLMNKVTGISESILISMFIAGLKSHIRRELQRARPTSLMETFALAREYEVHHEELRMELSRERRSVPWWQNKNITSITPTSSNNISSTNVGVSQLPATTTLPLPSNRTQNKTANSTLPIRRLTPQEMREKRAKGLCYNCDQQYTTNHRCQSKFLLLLGTDDGEDEGDNAEVGELPTHMSDEETIVLGDISSLHAMTGPGNPRSLQLWGQVGGDQIQVLIDGGSTHNFIQPSIAERLNLATKQVTPFRVYIGNGDSLACTYCCQNATLVMQGNEFEVDLYILPIQGPDVVLGVQWLQSLGKVTHDYANLTMEFNWKGKNIALTGIKSLNSRQASFTQLQAMMHKGQVAELYELLQMSNHLAPAANDESISFPVDLSPEIHQIIQNHEQLFQTPTGLPPRRPLSHHISLIPGVKPINLTFRHMLPNFNECWWDSIVLDILICNWFGIWAGMRTVRYFDGRTYEWVGISQQPNIIGKVKRTLGQFTPAHWDKDEWHPLLGPWRFLQVLSLCVVFLTHSSSSFVFGFLPKTL
nr:Transposon Ty3-G Gag-Pol polyprotein [Ipomoea batatas]